MDPDKPDPRKRYIAAGIIALFVFVVFTLIYSERNTTIEKAQPMTDSTLADSITGAAVAEALCRDSDGLNLLVKGNANLNEISVNDTCYRNKILEYYCGEKEGKEAILQKLVECPGGCEIGACKEYCFDTDGGIDIKTRSIIKSASSEGESANIEKCKDAKTLVEYFCSGSSIVEREISCSCKEGACA
ncbi:MAG TPA: hypothetical protein VJI46_01210 [Candidatus Nanoarchaeia archaeon]|nr:hypothetical protein [Candidatus Nanoarchaeia archaeon]